MSFSITMYLFSLAYKFCSSLLKADTVNSS